jgi:RNA-directed DNA polymerase
MMHGRWKSDSAVVAEKSVNKAELSAAELMERRAGAKGNVDQQTTCRAQNRESVSQALERIRQAARHRKKERFTSLLHHVSVDLLRLAFFELKRNAAPGVDGLTWQDYEADLELRLADLHARVQRGAYRALPSQRRYIPRPDGRWLPFAVSVRPRCLPPSQQRRRPRYESLRGSTAGLCVPLPTLRCRPSDPHRP